MDAARRADFSCECCGGIFLTPALEEKLDALDTELRSDRPRVAVGYRCEAARQAQAWRSDPAHTEGRAVTFHTCDQYYRHRLLAATLKYFEAVFIYPRRITVHVGTKQAAPYCLIM